MPMDLLVQPYAASSNLSRSHFASSLPGPQKNTAQRAGGVFGWRSDLAGMHSETCEKPFFGVNVKNECRKNGKLVQLAQ